MSTKTNASMINPFIKSDLDISEILTLRTYGISDTLESYFYQMTPTAYKVLTYLIMNLSIRGNDIVTIKVNDIMNLYNVKSKDSVYTAIKEFESIRLLEKKYSTDYWVNPFLLNFTKTDYFKLMLKEYCRDEYPNLYIKYFTNNLNKF